MVGRSKPFSVREGCVPESPIQMEGLSPAARIGLYNVVGPVVFENINNSWHSRRAVDRMARKFFGLSAEEVADFGSFADGKFRYVSPAFVKACKRYFVDSDWFRVYDIVEFFFSELESLVGIKAELERGAESRLSAVVAECRQVVNDVLEDENVGYRLVGGRFVPVTNSAELAEVGQAAAVAGRFRDAGVHVEKAIALFAGRPPDYANVVKESISAVEAVVRELTDKGTLSDGLRVLEDKGVRMHPAFRGALTKLYAFTGDEGGVRHGVGGLGGVDLPTARFMLVTCSAFVNYIVALQ